MGFLDALLNRNPTADWTPQRDLVLLLDVDQESLCGITIGDAISRVSKLGPAEDARSARHGRYRYPSLGFEITAEQGRVVEVELVFDPVECYGGHVTINGNELPLEGDITEQAIVAAAGPPEERKVDAGGDVTLQYRRRRADWRFELSGGTLDRIWGGLRD
jgi:hypothetical protein